MCGADITQASIFSYRTLEDRIPESHILRKLRTVVDTLLASMDAELNAVYAKTGRDSIPPERLLRASLIQTLHSIRSERVLVEHIDYNLLYRWFVGLGMDEKVWHHSTFSANRDRLLNERIARLFFDQVLHLAEWKGLLSSEHFTVDGTLIEAWASMKRFVARDGSGNPSDRLPQPHSGFQGREALQRHPCQHDGSGCPALQEGRRREVPSMLSGPHADGEPQRPGGGRGDHTRVGHGGAGSSQNDGGSDGDQTGSDARRGQGL